MAIKKPTVPVKTKAKPEVKVDVPVKHHYFPKILMLFGLIVFVIAIIDYFNFYNLPKIVVDIILLISGLWLFKLGLARGFYKKRKEVLKRYL